MTSRTCPTCKRAIEGDATRCPHDGAALPPARPSGGLTALGTAPTQKPPPPAPRPRVSPLANSHPVAVNPVTGSKPPMPSGAVKTEVSPRALAVPAVPAAPPARDSAPSIELIDTMSPESMEREGLVLEGPADVRFNEPGSGSLTGKLLAGKYRVVRMLGEGGMGEVFLAEHEAIGKRVAIKILRNEHAQKEDVVERFRLEARSASRIQHPSVVQVFDFGQIDDGRFYLALEYLEGVDLAEQLHQSRVLEPLRALYITLQVCAGLSAAHAVGVIHRDMKPENVFLQRNRAGFDDAKIVDFGIAKMREISERASIHPSEPVVAPSSEASRERRLTKAGSIFGTPEYMAPEQAAGREADHRADIYAVGIMLYEMLTGQVPFSSDSLLETLTKHISETPRPPRQVNPRANLSPQLEAVVLKAIAKLPEQRFASMDAFAEEIQVTPEGGDLLDAIRTSMPLSLQGVPSPRRPQVPGASPSVSSPRPSASRTDEPVSVDGRGSNAPLPLVTPARTSTSLDQLRFDDQETAASSGHPPSSRPVPITSRQLPRALALVGAAGALAAAAWLVRPQERAAGPGASPLPSQAVAATTQVVPAETTTAPPPAPAASPASAAPAASVAPASITLRVVTVPAGAVVHKGDFQVCDSSPCDVTVQPNEAVELVAVMGNLRGTAKVLAQRQQTVAIRLGKAGPLVAPGVPGTTVATVPTSAGGRNVAPVPMCEFTDGDLKILRPCK